MALLVLIGISATIGVAALGACSESHKEDQRSVVWNDVRAVSKLELIEQVEEEIMVLKGNDASLSSISSIDELFSYIDSFLRVGSRVGVYAYTHHFTAYIDLNKTAPDAIALDEQRHEARLTLPDIEIELSGRSGQIRLLHERITGTQPPITQQERSRLQQAALQKLQQRMRPGDIRYDAMVRRAESQAEAYFRGLLRSRGYTLVEVRFGS